MFDTDLDDQCDALRIKPAGEITRTRSARIDTEDLCLTDSPEGWFQRLNRKPRPWHDDDTFQSSSSSSMGDLRRSGTLRPMMTIDFSEACEDSFKQRLLRAEVADLQSLTWSHLLDAEASELVADSAVEADGEELVGTAGVCIDVNSGGQVFFALFGNGTNPEVAIVLKFCSPRHIVQAEQLAAELAWHVGVCAPMSRVLLRARDEDDWQQLASAARLLSNPCSSLADALDHYEAMLVLQFVPGKHMKTEHGAWDSDRLQDSARALGSLLVLDMMLDNKDRLSVAGLSWRGNPANIIWTESPYGGGTHGRNASRCVPIDAVLSYAPASFQEDSDCQAARVLELVLLDRASCYDVLHDILSCNSCAADLLKADWAACGNGSKAGPLPSGCAVKTFHEGIRMSLGLAQKAQGLIEMVVSVVTSWLDSFRNDPVLLRLIPDLKLATHWGDLRSIVCRASKTDANVKSRLSFWQDLIQDKATDLLQSVEDFAGRQNIRAPFSFRGFLGPTALSPLTDAHELVERLQQLLRRLRLLTEASLATRPADLCPIPLLVGPAMSACCLHYLRKVGVTCIINCTKDLPEPSQELLGADMTWHRVPLADTEDQDLSSALAEALSIIDNAVTASGRVLVHCHEGRSRSVSLCLAYMVTRERRPLKDALTYVKAKRREAAPNAGFLRQLVQLEETTLGSVSLTEADLPKGKPKGIVCPQCGEVVGLAKESLVSHIALKHSNPDSG
eukprot:TRINITY_DN64448_c0_g1_i1.p1 TRINITY_DN64448_c0_g1~~TRINITY_DN64448_c0_g1_i1.p1  ORF type:complete len:732 (-),score=56.09 TRINITY_DN64448_c0_g1_i1:94-2289(-)